MVARVSKYLFIALLGVLLVVGTIYANWVLSDHRLTVITPGRAFQSAAMSPEEMARVASGLKVQTVFDFRDDVDPKVFDAERGALQRDGIRYVHIPSSTSPAPETVDAFVHAMVRRLQNQLRVLRSGAPKPSAAEG